MTKLEEIISCIKGNSVYVQMHNFPDPDAIASAYGMKYLLRAEGIDAQIVYKGSIQPSMVCETPAVYEGNLWKRLSQSKFRSSFSLKENDRSYVSEKGMEKVREHACDFIRKRLAPAEIANDGKQTPMRGHPVFVAQHATATCCRGCLEKWHHIPKGRELTEAEQEYIVNVIMEWIGREIH